MKKILPTLLVLLASTSIAWASKIQQQGIVSHSDCVSRGVSDANCIPLTSQVWDSTNGQLLSSSISGGALGNLTVQTLTADATLAVHSRYIVNKSSTAANLTLPTSCALGDEIQIVGVGSGGWTLKSNASAAAQTVNEGILASNTSSSSAIQLVSSVSQNDCLTLICATTNSVWNALNYIGTSVASLTATGGTITTYSSGGHTFKVHTFTSSGTLQITSGSGNLHILVIGGGGGGGGGFYGGGGGAGGFIEHASDFYGTGSYTVTIGTGGSGGSAGPTSGSAGGNSVFDIITASGGGAGGVGNNPSSANGGNGGSGGGGGGNSPNTSGGTGIAGQGFAGSGGNVNNAGVGGGGGGCGSAASASATNQAGNGGTGCSSSINGTASFYASGGGGGANGGGGSLGVAGTASAGGGGNGNANGNGSAATANTGGGGGGGGSNTSFSGGPGATGIVIVSYPTS